MDHKIIIQFSIPKNPQWWVLSNLIRWSEFKKSLFPFKFFGRYHSSHTSILMDDFVFEAVLFIGCRKISKKNWDKKNKVNLTKEIEVNSPTFSAVQAYLEGSIGIRYSWAEAIGIFFQRAVYFFFKKRIKNLLKSNHRKLKCSQLCYEILGLIGVVSGLKDSSSIGVKDIENVLVNYK